MQVIQLDYTCADINIDQWNDAMYNHNPKKFSYTKAKKLIKKYLPDLYDSINLQLYNPCEDDTKITDKHIIITHSLIEYFISYTK